MNTFSEKNTIFVSVYETFLSSYESPSLYSGDSQMGLEPLDCHHRDRFIRTST